MAAAAPSRSIQPVRRSCTQQPVVFAKKLFDDEFHTLDNSIAEAARALPGYLGEETWENPTTGLVSNVYYWKSLEDLQRLVQHPKHLEAKAAQGKWLAGYQITIAEVVRVYGDSKLNHVLPVTSAA